LGSKLSEPQFWTKCFKMLNYYLSKNLKPIGKYEFNNLFNILTQWNSQFYFILFKFFYELYVWSLFDSTEKIRAKPLEMNKSLKFYETIADCSKITTSWMSLKPSLIYTLFMICFTATLARPWAACVYIYMSHRCRIVYGNTYSYKFVKDGLD